MRNLEAQMRGVTVPGHTKVPPILLTRQTLDSPKVKQLWEYYTLPLERSGSTSGLSEWTNAGVAVVQIHSSARGNGRCENDASCPGIRRRGSAEESHVLAFSTSPEPSLEPL